jgi:hypothetical protein
VLFEILSFPPAEAHFARVRVTASGRRRGNQLKLQRISLAMRDLGSERIMTMHHLIQNLAFNQDDIERLSTAYEDALKALHISDRDDPINQIIAQRIIEGARAGVRDPHDLCKMAVKDLVVP